MRALLPALVILAGCPSWPIQGSVAEALDGKPLSIHSTKQRCQKGAEAVAAADLAVPIALDVYRANGWCTDYDPDIYGKAHVCIIDQPEPCEPLPWPRHGCATMYGIQQSIKWPPLCEPGMPDALKCVESKEQQRSNWIRNFVHEVTNMVLWRCGIYDPPYKHPARGLEGEIWKRFEAANGR